MGFLDGNLDQTKSSFLEGVVLPTDAEQKRNTVLSKVAKYQAESQAILDAAEHPSFFSKVKGVIHELPHAMAQVFSEPFKHPIETIRSVVSGAANVGPDVVNLGSKVVGSSFRLPKLEVPGTSDVQNAIRGSSETAAGYELGGAALKPFKLSAPVSRVLGNVAGGQITSSPEATVKERANTAAFDALFGAATEGAGKAFDYLKKTKVATPEVKVPSEIKTTKAPTAEAPKVTTKEVIKTPSGVPESVKVTPISGTGETKVRGLAQGVEEKAVESKLTSSLGDLPEYKVVNMKDQALKATDILNKDYEQAKRIATGKELPPEGVLPESVYVAVENRALKEGDVQTIKDLATNSSLTTEATTMGQRIRTLAERNPDSPVSAIRDISEIRKVKAEKNLGVIKNQIKSAITKGQTKQTWSEFVDSIVC